MQSVRRVAIIGGNRIPFARSNGRYARATNQDMLTAALDGLIARYGLAGQRLGEVAAGAVLKHSRDYNLTRECVLGSRLDPHTPAYDVQQACGTGLEAAILVANKIALGQVEVGIAGGVDTTSDAPLQLNEDMRRTLLELNRARSLGGRLRAASRLRPTQPFRPEIPRNAEPRTGLSMGDHAAITAGRWGIERAAQDALALESHRRLAAAYDRGFFDDLLTPYLGLTRDQNLRPDTTLEKLAALKPVFGVREPGTRPSTDASTPGERSRSRGLAEVSTPPAPPGAARAPGSEAGGADAPTTGGPTTGGPTTGGPAADGPAGGGAAGGGVPATMTAGNSSPLTDGAAVVLLASEEWAKERRLPVLAYFGDSETAAVDFVHGAEGLLMAPAYAVPRLLARAGLTLQDFDFYEFHEAFASQVLATLAAWESPEFCKDKLGLDAPLGPIDRDRLNVNGSSLAAGHPFAATGGRIVATLAKMLAERGSGRGLISICAAGGQGVVAILER